MAGDIALGIMCKAPISGASKTRLCPPLDADEAAALSGCFIADVAATVAAVSAQNKACGYAIFTPAGAEDSFVGLLPPGFAVLAQRGADLSARLVHATQDLLAAGHAGVCLINADGPTLPASLLAQAVAELQPAGDRLVIGPAIDGGYTLIGLKQVHAALFQGVAWSTGLVLAQTLARAADLRLPLTLLPPWYDVDDGASLALLFQELFGDGIALAGDGLEGAAALHSRAYLGRLLQDGDLRVAFAGLTCSGS